MAAHIIPGQKIFYALGFFIRVIKGTGYFFFHWKAYYKILVMQILFTFVEALGISALLALGIGASVNIIVMPILTGFSQERLIYSLLIMFITRELGPLLVAFITIARSATAIATEIAGMVISHEVEAYISVGIDPIEYLAAPRFLGVTFSMFLLNIYFSIFGLAGSFVVTRIFRPIPADVYFFYLLQFLTIQDIIISLMKSIFFGMIISTVALLRGFSVELASTEVPVAGLKAVSSAFAWCIILDILLSALYYVVL